ncbi:hypothetical protein BDV93DRAFT_528159 [Ceratobasidium sp. AG-I]|nr:hypothetical protein BDV93DRAFT_528159 [Ceratobasidium sp. AG-I]
MFPHPQAGPSNSNPFPFFEQFPPPVDYNQLSDDVAERVVDRVVERITAQVVAGVTEQVLAGVAGQVANLFASQQEANGRINSTGGSKKQKERCGLDSAQRIITKVMLSGLRVSKVDQIGSPSQPGPLDVDGDDEGPWQFDWKAGPKGVEKQLAALHNANVITDAQFSERYVRSLLIHSFDAG